jgi:lysophospholipase L1-like esterase
LSTLIDILVDAKTRFFIFASICLLTSCATRPVETIPQDTGGTMSMRYLALGDSYTIGESVPEGERWPNQLAALLKQSGHEAQVEIIARTGWTTEELWQGIQTAEPQPPYDLVSLLIGVNNQYRGYDIEEYRQGFRFLLNKSIEYADGNKDRVFVVSIPDWGVTPFAGGRNVAQIASEIDAFNAVNRAEAEAIGVRYVDITPISRRATTDPALIAHDGLHPSGKMYGLWVELALPQVLEMLKQQ